MSLTTHVLRRSLTYLAKRGDIRAFLDETPVANKARSSGECSCKLPSKQDILKGLKLRWKQWKKDTLKAFFTVSVGEPTKLKRVGLLTDDAKVFMGGLHFETDAYMNEQFFVPLRCVEIGIGLNSRFYCFCNNLQKHVVTVLSVGAFRADVVDDVNQSFGALFVRTEVVAPMLVAVEEFIPQDRHSSLGK
uniref:DUF1336 domain-containing protein n=1 Tax=Angiostrongylus cantonensis TaxID=6313 RepID=A0A0K0D1R9_ANGCA